MLMMPYVHRWLRQNGLESCIISTSVGGPQCIETWANPDLPYYFDTAAAKLLTVSVPQVVNDALSVKL